MPTPWDALEVIAADEVSGATRVSARAARVLGTLRSRDERVRAARLLLRAKPAMAPLWHLCTLALDGTSATELRASAAKLEEAQRVAARNLAWMFPSRRALRLVTWSNASVLPLAIAELRAAEVRCARSDGHGARLSAALRRQGVKARVFEDLDILEAVRDADALLLGADALGARIVNAAGSELASVAARACEVPVYVVAAEQKLLPARIATRAGRGDFCSFDAERVDAVITEHGARTPRWLRAHGERVRIAPELLRLKR